MTDPVSITGLSLQLFTAASKSYTLLHRALSFSATSSSLILRLRLERIRFHLFGHSSGLTQNSLQPSLIPHAPIINDVLQRVARLLADGDALRKRYGLTPSDIDDERARESLSVKAALLRIGGVMPESPQMVAELERQFTKDLPDRVKEKPKLSALQRARWAVSSEPKFSELLEELKTLTDSLNELLTESMRAEVMANWTSVELRMLVMARSREEIATVKEAGHGYGDIVALTRKKELTLSDGRLEGPLLPAIMKDEFDLPDGYETSQRVVCAYTPSASSPTPSNTSRHLETYVMLEKRLYGKTMGVDDRRELKDRLDRLLRLLDAKCPDTLLHLKTLKAIGYVHDPDNYSWWIVYQLSSSICTALSNISGSVPLISLADTLASGVYPALEHRVQLASKLATTFTCLFASGWLHKGVRSDNVILEAISPMSKEGSTLAEPALIGFEAARRYSELVSWDFRVDQGRKIMYQHPSYQGPRAKGYRMRYDIYSLGLLLGEIAFWEPLWKLIGYKTAEEVDAGRVMRLVQKRVNKEVAFRCGTVMKAVILWCLGFGEAEGSESEEMTLPEEFYRNVHVPLQELKLK